MRTAPRSNARMAQLTGLIVTSIVVFGTDTDVLLAVPMGVLAGALAIFFMSLADSPVKAKR